MKPVLKIKGKVQNIEKKEKNKPLMKTNFLLTINTNQQYKDNDKHLDDDIKIFENTIQDILNKIDEFINLPQGDKWDDETIKDVDIDYTIERGTKKGHVRTDIGLSYALTYFCPDKSSVSNLRPVSSGREAPAGDPAR